MGFCFGFKEDFHALIAFKTVTQMCVLFVQRDCQIWLDLVNEDMIEKSIDLSLQLRRDVICSIKFGACLIDQPQMWLVNGKFYCKFCFSGLFWGWVIRSNLFE